MSPVQDEIARITKLICGAIGPSGETDAVAEATGALVGKCRFCGAKCAVSITMDTGTPRVVADHDTPVCPEFVRYCEDLP